MKLEIRNDELEIRNDELEIRNDELEIRNDELEISPGCAILKDNKESKCENILAN